MAGRVVGMITVLTLLGVTATAAVLLLLAFDSEEDVGLRSAHLLSEAVAAALAAHDPNSLSKSQLQDLLDPTPQTVEGGSSGELSYVLVVNEQGRRSASSDEARPVNSAELNTARLVMADDEATMVESLPAGIYAGTAPIRSGDGAVLGAVRVEFENNEVGAHFEMYRAEYLAGVAVILAALIVGSWFLSRRLARPIGLMVDAARAVEAGRQPGPGVAASLRNTSLTRDEYGELAGVFLDMALEVGQREVRLNALVDERTQELSVQNRALEETQREIRNDLEMAHSVQAALVPLDLPQDPRAEVAAYMTPALDVGGDFYDAFLTDDGRLALAIADVSGKGVASALMMAVGRSVLRSAANQYPDPSQAVKFTNDELCGMNPKELFITCFFGVIDCELATLTYVNAGHDPPYIMRPGAGPEMLPMTGGMALGVMPGLNYAETTIPLDPGVVLYLYTDGVTEAENASGQQFSRERLESKLAASVAMGPQALMDEILTDLRSFTGDAKQFDDLTCMVVQFLGGAVEQSHIPARDERHLASGWRRMVVQAQLDSSLPRVQAFIERFAKNLGLGAGEIYRINLALDELITNTIEHGFPGRQEEADIVVAVRNEGETIVVRYEDNGPEFDPLQAAAQDTELALEERPIGGLGLQLIASTFENMSYERSDERNVTTLRYRRAAADSGDD